MAKYDNIYEAIAEIPNGKFFKITYRTSVPLKAKDKQDGFEIIKYTTRITRTGIRYKNIRAARISNHPTKFTANSNWLIPNKIKTNMTTEKDYLVIVPMLKGEAKSYKYHYIWNKITYDTSNELKLDHVLPSYIDKTNGPIRMINLDNICCIKYGGEILYENLY